MNRNEYVEIYYNTRNTLTVGSINLWHTISRGNVYLQANTFCVQCYPSIDYRLAYTIICSRTIRQIFPQPCSLIFNITNEHTGRAHRQNIPSPHGNNREIF